MQRMVLPGRASTLIPLLAVVFVVLGAAVAGVTIGLNPLYGAVILAAPLLLVGAWVAYKLPGLTFAAYLAIPFYKAATDPFMPVSLTIILAFVNILQGLIVFLPWINDVVLPRLAAVHQRRALVIWLSLTLLILLGVLYAPAPDIALGRALNWVMLSALPLLAAFRVATDPRYVRQFLWSLYAVGVAVTVVGLFLLPQVGEWPTDRLIVFGAHTIRVGQAALLVPMLTFAFILPASRSPARLLCLALVPPALLVATSSGSRGPLLMAVLTLAIFGIRAVGHRIARARRQPLRIAPIRVAVAGLIAGLLVVLLQPAALFALVPEAATQRLSTVTNIVTSLVNQDLSASTTDASTAGRLIAYEGAIDMFNESPIFGGGTASFFQFTESIGFTDWTVDVAYPHNLVLQFAAEYGLVGLVVLLVLLTAAFRNLLALARDPGWNTVLVLLIYFLLSALISHGILDNRTLWGLILLGIAAPATSVARAVVAPGARDVARGKVAASALHNVQPRKANGRWPRLST